MGRSGQPVQNDGGLGCTWATAAATNSEAGPGVTASADDIRAHCRARISAHKVPRYIWFLDAPLPRNANGKFLKRELRVALKTADAV
jgi:acyl-CoA synthetase (AMP-forming)/AMP-acid ligase II